MHHPVPSDERVRLAPLRPARVADERCRVEHRADGSWIMERVEPLAEYPQRLTDRLTHWAAVRPDHTFFAHRPPGPVETTTGQWTTWSYARTLEAVRSVGQALLDRGLSAEQTVMILSENDIENQLLALACTHVGVPYVPVTPAYSLLAPDHARLKWLAARIQPALVFASDGDLYGRALQAAFPECQWVATHPGASRAQPFAELLATRATPAVELAHEAIRPDHVAKVLFTSGTTGEPKGVLFSHDMICSNRQQVVQAMPFLEQEPLVLVDWLPWHHTFGGTQNLGTTLYCGGSYYLDPGKPTPEGIAATVQTLREVAPTFYCSTPSGIDALLPHLRNDAALRERFFSKLLVMQYGGAVFPAHLWNEFDELSVAHCGQRLLFVSGLGSTECGPVAAISCRDPERKPLVGLPTPGIMAKLIPCGAVFELRFKGPSISPGYWGDPKRSAESRDDEDFFCLGDAVDFVDANRPELGLVFAGRIAENFKLATGTWVVAAALREAAIAALAPLAREVVIAGEGQNEVGALVFPDVDACRALDTSLPPHASSDAVLASPVVQSTFQRALDALFARGGGSAARLARIRLESEPPTLDNGELTAKSAVSAANVLRRRAAAVADLFNPSPSALVIRASRAF